ncbi:efflux RND transporter periplasmic adaptor subunit [Microbulbifer sp. 2205BS26-8]|uniref:efflux RND transporter periplasmic adaptor subunit n=1 Tax=Microbulbifer sp. 2205BS26-8 TaxID=3064386 RepID=UPI00273DFAA8|nr:efflux RND transporter periplasmic adaptor subunit [Microbulbifer sp. 2205BS26-8]MDP5208891.1 efflux RND transporter periplasmic adaptor subunit [Microbulbifer sp. 2205BS26-8]
MKKTHWRWIVPVVLVLAALQVAGWMLREKPSMARSERRVPPPAVEVAVAESGRFPVTFSALGKVSARELAEVQPQVQGVVEWLNYGLGPGSILPKGQVLLRIEAEPYQLALQTARSSLAERRAELQQELGQQQVALEEYALLATSLPESDRALVLREPQLAQAQARVQAAEVSVGLAERDLRLTRIRAPFDALVVTRTVDVGDRVAPGNILYSLASADRFQIAVEVPAAQLHRLTTATNEVRIYGSQWPQGVFRRGEFVRTIPVLEEQGRLASVLVELEDPLSVRNPGQPQLLLNDLARVEIVSQSEEQSVRIPLVALQDGNRVWVVKDNRTRVLPVEVAYTDGDYALLEQGLNGGETLVTTRLVNVIEDMPVRIAAEVRAQQPLGTEAAVSARKVAEKRVRSSGSGGADG